jgi:hypothetical protein
VWTNRSISLLAARSQKKASLPAPERTLDARRIETPVALRLAGRIDHRPWGRPAVDATN